MVKITDFGRIYGRRITLYILENSYLQVGITDFGAIIQFIKVKTDREPIDVTVGAKNSGDYVNFYEHFGGTIGRVANRIANATFTLNDNLYCLDKNDGKNNLHSGFNCYDKRFFNAFVGENKVVMTILSKHLDQGFPGNLEFSVEFELFGSNLQMNYIGKSDRDTPFAPTSHTYFNLDGEGNGAVYDNQLMIYSDKVTCAGADLLPTGEIMSVKGTALDFTSFKPIGKDLFFDCETLKYTDGYDHNYVCKGELMATAYSKKTGIKLNVCSDMPGLQFYSGNFMTDFEGKSHYSKHYGFCLEPQFFPNALNLAAFASPVIPADSKVIHYIRYEFFFDEKLKETN